MRDQLLNVQLLTATREMLPEWPSGQFSAIDGRRLNREILPEWPSGQFSAIESSPVLKSQFEIVMSFAGPSKWSPSVLKPLLSITHPDTATWPTFESRIWNAGALTTTTFSMVMWSKFIRLMPQK